MLAQPRLLASDVELRAVPADPGVYAWFRNESPIYAGKASGKEGLRSRLGNHLATGLDLSRSSLRRNVADHLLGIPTEVTRQRPPRVSPEDVAAINGWIHRLSLCWLVLPTADEAVTFERVLLQEWMPPLSRR
jgi:hypothetical protein